MAMSKGVSIGSIVTGFLLLLLTLISVNLGWVVMINLTEPDAGVSIGLWGFYFAVPGVFSILAGFKRQTSLLAFALATDILGSILGTVGLIIGEKIWSSLMDCFDETSWDDNSHHPLDTNYCYCSIYDYFNNPREYRILCSSLMTFGHANAAVTIIFAFFASVTLVGSIYGCIGTCCAPKEPAVTVTTAQPGTMAMTAQSYPADSQQPPPYYLGQVVVDSKPQIKD